MGNHSLAGVELGELRNLIEPGLAVELHSLIGSGLAVELHNLIEPGFAVELHSLIGFAGELHYLLELAGELHNLIGVDCLRVGSLLVAAGLDSWADSLQVGIEVEQQL